MSSDLSAALCKPVDQYPDHLQILGFVNSFLRDCRHVAFCSFCIQLAASWIFWSWRFLRLTVSFPTLIALCRCSTSAWAPAFSDVCGCVDVLHSSWFPMMGMSAKWPFSFHHWCCQQTGIISPEVLLLEVRRHMVFKLSLFMWRPTCPAIGTLNELMNSQIVWGDPHPSLILNPLFSAE